MKATDKIQLLERVRTLEGLTDAERDAILSLINEHKTYGLVWEDKSEEAVTRLAKQYPVLTEVQERAIISDNPDSPNHILIEGDNLDALTALTFTHEGKIDVIYIDPPYNTGNKDFIYNDSYVDKDDGYRHSMWLSFMSRRLKIAKKLLSERGVIFISIDDNELAQLKMLCDEIFGAVNFIDIFSWNKTETPANLSLKTKKAIEYVLCYCKQRNSDKFRGLIKSSASNNGLMNQTNSEHVLVFPKSLTDTKLPDGVYAKGVYGTKAYHIELLEDTEVKDGLFVLPVVLKGKFKWSQKNLDLEISKGTKVSIKTKAFSPSYEKTEYDPEVPWNLIDRTFGVDTNEIAGTQGIEYDENKEDRHICENVTFERNKRVIEGYTKPDGEHVEGLYNNNIRYYRIDFVSREHTLQNRRELMEKSIDLLCIKENLYTELPRFGRICLNPNGARYFADNKKQMLIIYIPEFIPYFVKEIDKMEVSEPIKVYVYAPDRYAYDDEFSIVRDKVSLCALPQNIIEAMARVMPDRVCEDNAASEETTIETLSDDENSLFDKLEPEEL